VPDREREEQQRQRDRVSRAAEAREDETAGERRLDQGDFEADAGGADRRVGELDLARQCVELFRCV
jgi:hypothetical protein